MRTLARTLRPALIPLAAAIVAATIWFGGMEQLGTWQDGQIVDTPTYLHYADAAANGQLPYRDVQVEYPPLAFAVILPPRIVSADYDRFTSAFSALMGACAIVAALATAAAAGAARRSRLRRLAAGTLVAAGPALAGSVSLTRFDLWPVALVALGLWALAARRDGTAGLLLGLAVAAKLWPVLVLPGALALALRRGTLRRTALAAVLGAGVPFAFALGLSPGGLWHALTIQGGRPLQVESLGAAALAVLASHGIGGPYTVITSSGSQNLQGSLVGIAGALSTVCSLVGLAGASVLGARAVLRAADERAALSEGARWALAAVAAGIAFGHVLSPQFMLWLLPFPLLVAGRRGVLLAALVVTACLLTLEEFPGRYWEYAAGLSGWVATLILVRDLVLVAIVVVAAVPGLSPRASGEPSRPLLPVPS